MNIEPQQSYFAHIPGHILNNKKISSVCKIFYAELTTLIHKEGYCWAQNNYFVKHFGKDKRTIQRWIDTLEKERMIVVTYEDPKTGSGRKIYTLESWHAKHGNSKISYPVTKMSPPHDKNVAHSIKTSNTYSKNKKTTTQPPKNAASPPVVVSSFLENKLKEIPGMSDKLCKKVVKDYSPEELKTAYEFAMAPEAENPIAVFQSALKEKWQKTEKIDPKKLVEATFQDEHEYNGAICQISPSGIIFHRGRHVNGVKFDDPKFLLKLRALLTEFKIKKDV